MYTLKTNADFDSAHFLSGYEGKCSNIHGHRWNVEIEVGGDKLNPEGQTRGMIVDFSELKHALSSIVEELDHSLIIERGSLREKTYEALMEEGFRIVELDMRPTAENLAKYMYDSMSLKGYMVVKATVYETPNNCASYCEVQDGCI